MANYQPSMLATIFTRFVFLQADKTGTGTWSCIAMKIIVNCSSHPNKVVISLGGKQSMGPSFPGGVGPATALEDSFCLLALASRKSSEGGHVCFVWVCPSESQYKKQPAETAFCCHPYFTVSPHPQKKPLQYKYGYWQTFSNILMIRKCCSVHTENKSTCEIFTICC